MKDVDSAALIFQELAQRCLFEDARIMGTFIRDIKAVSRVSYSDRQSLFQQQKHQAVLRLPCSTALDHYFSLNSLYLGNVVMNSLVNQPVWIDKLIAQSEELMQFCDDDPYIIYLRAKILLANNQNEEALSLLANCTWHNGKGNFLIWKLFIENVPSIEVFNEYTKDLGSFMKTLSLLYMGAKRQFFIPFHLVQSFVKANSTNPYIATLNAAFHANQNKDTDTDYLINSVKHSSFFLDFADIFSHRFFTFNQLQELRSLVEQIKLLNKHDYVYYIVLGNYHSLINDHHESIRLFEKAANINKRDPLPRLLMGFEYFGIGNKTEALECYYKAYRLAETDYRVLYALGYFNEKAGFYARAIEFYLRLVAQRPFDARFTIALAECHGYLEHNEEMLEFALKAFEIGPCPSYANSIGIAYKNLNKQDKALAYFTQALEGIDCHVIFIIDVGVFADRRCVLLHTTVH